MHHLNDYIFHLTNVWIGLIGNQWLLIILSIQHHFLSFKWNKRIIWILFSTNWNVWFFENMLNVFFITRTRNFNTFWSIWITYPFSTIKPMNTLLIRLSSGFIFESKYHSFLSGFSCLIKRIEVIISRKKRSIEIIYTTKKWYFENI